MEECCLNKEVTFLVSEIALASYSKTANSAVLLNSSKAEVDSTLFTGFKGFFFWAYNKHFGDEMCSFNVEYAGN